MNSESSVGPPVVTHGLAPHSRPKHMQLFVTAVVHPDVLGRQNLRCWLERLRGTNATPPAFIAVEYAQEDFDQIRSQRDTFADFATLECPDAPPELLSALAPTLAYEADTHTEVFPQPIEVLWLDQGRREPYDGAVRDFAKLRLWNYYSPYWWTYAHPSASVADALAAMSRAAWDFVDREHQTKPPQPDARDDAFARLILQRVYQAGGDWAIIVVGTNHASDQPGFMLRQLLDAGIPCHVHILDPRPKLGAP